MATPKYRTLSKKFCPISSLEMHKKGLAEIIYFCKFFLFLKRLYKPARLQRLRLSRIIFQGKLISKFIFVHSAK